MKSFLISILFLVTNAVSAQLVTFTHENVAGEELIFTPAFIQANGIRTGYIEFSVKEEGERIQNLVKKWVFSYDEKGMLKRLIKIDRPYFITPDTSTSYYHFNERGLLRIRRTFTKTSVKGEYFEYDEHGRIIKYIITKENNAGKGELDFKPSQQQVEFLETYAYEKLSDNQVKVRVMNDDSLIYKEGIIYTKGGKVIEKDFRFVITRLRANEKISYDNRDRIASYIHFSDAAGDNEEMKKITYDDNSNIKIIEYFRNGELVNQIHFFYDKKNLLLEGDVNREMKTGKLFLRNYKFSSTALD